MLSTVCSVVSDGAVGSSARILSSQEVATATRFTCRKSPVVRTIDGGFCQKCAQPCRFRRADAALAR
jgi:hypothetical protein